MTPHTLAGMGTHTFMHRPNLHDSYKYSVFCLQLEGMGLLRIHDEKG